MRRLPTLFAAAGAAAVCALAVTVAAPAIGDQKSDDFASCIRERGLDDAPRGGVALKRWLGERLERGGQEVEEAVDACAPPKPGRPAADERELRACLEQHGAEIEGNDPAAIKRWILDHESEPEARDALKACHAAVPGATKPSACGDSADAKPSRARARVSEGRAD